MPYFVPSEGERTFVRGNRRVEEESEEKGMLRAEFSLKQQSKVPFFHINDRKRNTASTSGFAFIIDFCPHFCAAKVGRGTSPKYLKNYYKIFSFKNYPLTAL